MRGRPNTCSKPRALEPLRAPFGRQVLVLRERDSGQIGHAAVPLARFLPLDTDALPDYYHPADRLDSLPPFVFELMRVLPRALAHFVDYVVYREQVGMSLDPFTLGHLLQIYLTQTKTRNKPIDTAVASLPSLQDALSRVRDVDELNEVFQSYQPAFDALLGRLLQW
jgi:hypothetical protein